MFNHFGDRGVVDAILRRNFAGERKATWLVCEIKPQLFDIGETIRQVRRAQEYFCKARPDMRVDGWENEYRYLLVVEANRENAIQVVDTHRDLFAGIEVAYHHEDQRNLALIRNMEEILREVVAASYPLG